MTLRPPQPPKSSRSLDADEHALAKSLPRLHGRTAPGPDLDARILAAAQAAVHPAKPARTKTRPRVAWIAPASLAASLVLAVGIAWQLRPLPTLESAQPTAQADSADMAAVQIFEPAPSDDPAPMVQSKPAQVPAQAATAARQLEIPAIVSTGEQASAPEARVLQTPAPPPPPPLSVSAAPPSPPAPSSPTSAAGATEAPASSGSSATPSAGSAGNSLEAQTLDTQIVDRAMRARPVPPAAAARASSADMARQAAPASADKAEILERTQQPTPKAAAAAPVMSEARKEAPKAADVGFADDPEEDVPPATADSPAVRDAWLHRIGELLEQGKQQEAKASLAEFRRRYPAAALPPRLHALEIEP